MVKRRIVLHDAAMADGRSDALAVGVSLSIRDGAIEWIRPTGDADLEGADVVDVGGATIVPAFVDGHSHLTLPGGSHWIDRGHDGPDILRRVAQHNARRLIESGVLWAVDVGAPTFERRALSLEIRDESRGRLGEPYIRAAGTWVAKTGYLYMCVDASDGAELKRCALEQLDAGSDFVKIMLDLAAGDRRRRLRRSRLMRSARPYKRFTLAQRESLRIPQHRGSARRGGSGCRFDPARDVNR